MAIIRVMARFFMRVKIARGVKSGAKLTKVSVKSQWEGRRGSQWGNNTAKETNPRRRPEPKLNAFAIEESGGRGGAQVANLAGLIEVSLSVKCSV